MHLSRLGQPLPCSSFGYWFSKEKWTEPGFPVLPAAQACKGRLLPLHNRQRQAGAAGGQGLWVVSEAYAQRSTQGTRAACPSADNLPTARDALCGMRGEEAAQVSFSLTQVICPHAQSPLCLFQLWFGLSLPFMKVTEHLDGGGGCQSTVFFLRVFTLKGKGYSPLHVTQQQHRHRLNCLVNTNDLHKDKSANKKQLFFSFF